MALQALNSLQNLNFTRLWGLFLPSGLYSTIKYNRLFMIFASCADCSRGNVKWKPRAAKKGMGEPRYDG